LLFIWQFKTKGGSQLKEYCTNLTKEDCRRQSGSFVSCAKVNIITLVLPAQYLRPEIFFFLTYMAVNCLQSFDWFF
jgi:hypothetical protein